MSRRFDIADFDPEIPSLDFLEAQEAEYNRVMAACNAKTEATKDIKANHIRPASASELEATPASTFGASTLVNQSPMTPSRTVVSGQDTLVHRKSNSSNIIANGHLTSSPANSSEVKNGSIRASFGTDDPFVAASSNDVGESNIAHRPRADRDLSEINADNAQSVLAPNACVFVANLLSTKSDDELCHAVQQVFEAFGECYTKVRRDEKGMPFAFVQFRERVDSETAIEHGRGLSIVGRPCRTERAKVPRALYLSRIVGGKIQESEARSVLERYGAIEKVWHASPTDREMFRLPLGIWVEFAYFGDARDARNALRTSTKFRLEQPPIPEDLKARIDNRYFNKKEEGDYTTANVGPNTPLERRSLFLGNLSFTTNPDQIHRVFSEYGVIRSIEIIFRVQSVHAFLEYDNEVSASRALSSDHVVSGRRLRIEPRMSMSSRNTNIGGSSNNIVLTPNPQGAVAGFPNTVTSATGMLPVGSSMSNGHLGDLCNVQYQPYIAAQMMHPFNPVAHVPQSVQLPQNVLTMQAHGHPMASRFGFEGHSVAVDPYYGMPQQVSQDPYSTVGPSQ